MKVFSPLRPPILPASLGSVTTIKTDEWIISNYPKYANFDQNLWFFVSKNVKKCYSK